ncbi:MAG: response regulator [Clostridia bacterium]|nr:response regulator [Clostridia bacterium]
MQERAQKSILVVSGTDKLREALSSLLPCAEFVLYTAASCAEARRMLLRCQYDVILISAPLPDEFGTTFALDLAQRNSSGVILLVRGSLFEEICAKVESYGVLTVEKPTPRPVLYAAIRMAAAMRARLARAEAQTQSLTAKMEEIRIVNRAKWVLIKYLNIDEAQAHRHIEKQAMDRRLSKREVAEKIISTYEG